MLNEVKHLALIYCHVELKAKHLAIIYCHVEPKAKHLAIIYCHVEPKAKHLACRRNLIPRPDSSSRPVVTQNDIPRNVFVGGCKRALISSVFACLFKNDIEQLSQFRVFVLLWLVSAGVAAGPPHPESRPKMAGKRLLSQLFIIN